MENITNESLTQLIREILGIDICRFSEDAKKYPLLSAKFGVEPYQMLVLLEAIENKYQIKISQEDIVNRKFNSYIDILEIINKDNQRKEGRKNGY